MANLGFPNLHAFVETSPATPKYNCIAWAAEDTENFWWPKPDPGYYWPPTVLREVEIGRFIEAFRTCGYEPCDNGDREAGWQKVVIYAQSDGTPTHMARQLEDGRWTSKLGNNIDITHPTVEALEGNQYGKAAQYLRRKNPKF
jgi:hypothetical protein